MGGYKALQRQSACSTRRSAPVTMVSTAGAVTMACTTMLGVGVRVTMIKVWPTTVITRCTMTEQVKTLRHSFVHHLVGRCEHIWVPLCLVALVVGTKFPKLDMSFAF